VTLCLRGSKLQKVEAKKAAAEKAVSFVTDGMLVGLGTGSTSAFAIRALGERVKAGLRIRALASSVASEALAAESGIPLVPAEKMDTTDLYIDGADEIDRSRNLIKGGGGALLREKILAFHSRSFIVIADESKLVDHLGAFPLPVEIVPFGSALTLKELILLGCEAGIRQKDGKPFITDNGNLIADCRFGSISDPEGLNRALLSIPGVVECGLFLHPMVGRVIVGHRDGRVTEPS
jgi:ribose 5-phosphate isomerase A